MWPAQLSLPTQSAKGEYVYTGTDCKKGQLPTRHKPPNAYTTSNVGEVFDVSRSSRASPPARQPSLPKETLVNLAAIVSPPARTQKPSLKTKEKIHHKTGVVDLVDPLEEELAILDGPASDAVVGTAFYFTTTSPAANDILGISSPPSLNNCYTPPSSTASAAAAAAPIPLSPRSMKRQMSDPDPRKPKRVVNKPASMFPSVSADEYVKKSSFWLLIDPVYGSKGKEIIDLEKSLKNYVELAPPGRTSQAVVAFYSRVAMTKRKVSSYLRLDTIDTASPIAPAAFKNMTGTSLVYTVVFKDPSTTLFQRLEVLENMIKEFPGHVFHSAEDERFMRFPHYPTRGATSLDIKEHLEPIAVLENSGLDRPTNASNNWRKGYLFMVKDAVSFKALCENSAWLKSNVVSIHLYRQRACILFLMKPSDKSRIFNGLGKRASDLILKSIFFRLSGESVFNLTRELPATDLLYSYDYPKEVIKEVLAKAHWTMATGFRRAPLEMSQTFVVETRKGVPLTSAQIDFIWKTPKADYIMHAASKNSMVLIAVDCCTRTSDLYVGKDSALLEDLLITAVDYSEFFAIIRREKLEMAVIRHNKPKTG